MLLYRGKIKKRDVEKLLEASPQNIEGMELREFPLIGQLPDNEIPKENHVHFQNKLESFYKLDLKQKDNTIQFKTPNEYPENLEREGNSHR